MSLYFYTLSTVRILLLTPSWQLYDAQLPGLLVLSLAIPREPSPGTSGQHPATRLDLWDFMGFQLVIGLY